MLARAKNNYTWDAENRLLTASNLTTAVVCNFIYDHQSRRISKTTLTPDPFNSLTSNFTYDGWNLISEVADDQTTATTNIYVWGLDLSGTLQGAGGVGGLLSQTIITPTTVSSYFPLADAKSCKDRARAESYANSTCHRPRSTTPYRRTRRCILRRSTRICIPTSSVTAAIGRIIITLLLSLPFVIIFFQ